MIQYPRIRFASLPTPLEPMPRLSAALHGPRLFIKRDDLTGLAFGGNKTRKLEYVLAEAMNNGAKTLITTGAVQSNHCRQTAALAARMGLDCVLVLTGEPPQRTDANLLLDHLFGATIVWCAPEDCEHAMKRAFDEAWEAGKRPFSIPLGASTPVGTMGYARAFEEWQEQGGEADWMLLGCASGGTQAGLLLGAALAGWTGRVLAISVGPAATDLQARVAWLVAEAADRLGKKVTLSAEDVLVNDDYLGAGYSVMGAPEMEAIQLFAQYEGIVLDPVYTGRAAAGMIDLIRKGFFKETDRVLFWHTGGGPTLFAEKYQSQFR